MFLAGPAFLDVSRETAARTFHVKHQQKAPRYPGGLLNYKLASFVRLEAQRALSRFARVLRSAKSAGPRRQQRRNITKAAARTRPVLRVLLRSGTEEPRA